ITAAGCQTILGCFWSDQPLSCIFLCHEMPASPPSPLEGWRRASTSTVEDVRRLTVRVAAIEVSHWHALYDAAYLRHLVAMPDVELVAIQGSDAGLVTKRAAEVGSPPTFTDYRKMLATIRPDFVLALGRHRQMAGIAHDLLDRGYPFLMEKPMGINAPEVEAV